MIWYHTTAFFAGFLLDLLFGDPVRLPHPVRLIGWLIHQLEEKLYGESRPVLRGSVLVITVLAVTGGAAGGILWAAYALHPGAGWLMESGMTFQILAVKSLRTESGKVYDGLKAGKPAEAGKAVSRIVGRDTERLDEAGIIRAAVETVAENTSDGAVAPMLYLALGGPFLGFLYKAVNTMDSMIGYRNDRYLFFGRAAAKLDDAVNFLPSRICAFLMLAAAFLGGSAFDGKRAYRIYRRDRRKHESPNAGQTEAVCAGALGIRLAGDASYFGKPVKKPWIGDAVRQTEAEDIRRSGRLLYLTAGLCEGICLLALCIAGIAG